MKTLGDCVKLTVSLRTDLLKKQRDLKAEFAGQIPAAFNDFLLTKRKRVDKQQARCNQEQQVPGKLFTQAHTLLRQVEPRNLSGVAVRFKKIETGRARYNEIMGSLQESKQ